MAHGLTKKQQQLSFLNCPPLQFHTTINYFSIGLGLRIKSGLYTITSNEEFMWLPYTKKVMVTLFGCFLPGSHTTSFWTPWRPLQLGSMNVCRQHWSTGRPQFFSIIVPNCINNTSKDEHRLSKDFPQPSCWPAFSTTDYHFFQCFNKCLLPQPAGIRKCLQRVYWTWKF